VHDVALCGCVRLPVTPVGRAVGVRISSQCRRSYRSVFGAAEAGYWRGGNLPVDERAKLTYNATVWEEPLNKAGTLPPNRKRPRQGQATMGRPSLSAFLVPGGTGLVCFRTVGELLKRGKTVRD
jgi:hypothetical protein